MLESGRPINFDPGPVDVALEYGGKNGATDMDTFSGVHRDGTFSIETPQGSPAGADRATRWTALTARPRPSCSTTSM